MSSYTLERQIAELAVLRASILTKRVQSTVSGISKADDSPVTAADFAAQAVLISALRKAFPGDNFVGEEDSSALREDPALKQRVWELASSAHLDNTDDEALLASPKDVEELLEVIDLGGRGQGGRKGRFWVMDPIDGTATFLKGEQYAVSLALVEDGREVVGVLGCANLKPVDDKVAESTIDKDGLGLMLTAVRGQGTTIRKMDFSGLQPAQTLDSVSKASSPAEAQIINYSSGSTSRHDLIRKLASSFGAKFPNIELYSSHIRYAALLVGDGDFQLRIPSSDDVMMHIWDHAGAQLILTEAGGKVTDLDGKDMDFGAGRDLSQNNGLLAARQGIHAAVLESMKKILAEDAAST
ncbi:3'(2'),5'-bisphosphate nucleotidase [Fusarium proliferatum]|nr:3'(2'),5'-bisphosphate nucleotidase [Fusarium proliferatum]